MRKAKIRKRLRLFLHKKCTIVRFFVVSLHMKNKLSYIYRIVTVVRHKRFKAILTLVLGKIGYV